MPAPVYIVGSAACTALGRSAASSSAAALAGISRLQESGFVHANGAPVIAAFDRDLAFDLTADARMFALARQALREVLGDPAVRTRQAVSLRLALPEPRPAWSADSARAFADKLVARSPCFSRPESLMLGHAAVLEAMRRALDDIEDDPTALAVVGGVDSYLHDRTLDWLEAAELLAMPGRRTGFPPGEAAGFVVLAGAEACRRLRLTPLARVRSIACSQEHVRSDSDDVDLGEGLIAAVTRALAPLAEDELVDAVYTDINGERWRAEEWAFVALRLGERLRDAAAYRTAVDSWGDVGAASGALDVILCAHAWSRGLARGERALVCGSSATGLRAAALLERVKPAGGGR